MAWPEFPPKQASYFDATSLIPSAVFEEGTLLGKSLQDFDNAVWYRGYTDNLKRAALVVRR